jgi:CheY-like chemotaxis protein
MGDSRRILLVEDDHVTRTSVALALELQGYEVSCAANGQEALDHLRGEGPPCLILLDLMMPVMDGWKFREEQRRDPALAAIPVVVVSADGTTPQKAAALGADDYLRKPVEVDELYDKVQRFC